MSDKLDEIADKLADLIGWARGPIRAALDEAQREDQAEIKRLKSEQATILENAVDVAERLLVAEDRAESAEAQLRGVGIVPYLDRMKELADARDAAEAKLAEAQAALAAQETLTKNQRLRNHDLEQQLIGADNVLAAERAKFAEYRKDASAEAYEADRLRAKIAKLVEALTSAVSWLQDLSEGLRKRCAKDLSHDHDTLRMVRATLKQVDAIHAAALAAAKASEKKPQARDWPEELRLERELHAAERAKTAKLVEALRNELADDSPERHTYETCTAGEGDEVNAERGCVRCRAFLAAAKAGE